MFTWRMNLYRVLVGAIVLALVIPASVAGFRAIWLVAIASVLIVVGAVYAGTRVAPIQKWLHR